MSQGRIIEVSEILMGSVLAADVAAAATEITIADFAADSTDLATDSTDHADFAARVTMVDEAPGVYTADTTTPTTAPAATRRIAVRRSRDGMVERAGVGTIGRRNLLRVGTCCQRPAFASRVVPVIVITNPAQAVPLAEALLAKAGAIPAAGSVERGTTVWVNVADIGTQTSNAPRSGISY